MQVCHPWLSTVNLKKQEQASGLTYIAGSLPGKVLFGIEYLGDLPTDTLSTEHVYYPVLELLRYSKYPEVGTCQPL